MRPPDYERGSIRLWNGDALDLLSAAPDAAYDCVLTDPPYLIGKKSDLAGKCSPWADQCNAGLFFATVYRHCKRALNERGCLWTFLSWRTLAGVQKGACDANWWVESLLVWDKGGFGPGSRGLRPQYELVALLIKEAFAIEDRSVADVCRFPWMTRKRHHPAEKPAALCQWLLGISRATAVLDPFLGSGTTAIAAARTGARCDGFDLDRRAFDAACRRIDSEFDGRPL